MSILYCEVTWKAINGTLIIKDDSHYWTAYINIMDKNWDFYQIHGKEYKEEIIWGNLVRLNGVWWPNDVSYTINRFTKEVVFLWKTDSQWRFIEENDNIKECNFWSHKMKDLPEPYSPQESLILVVVSCIIFLLLYIILRKYIFIFWKKSKHKK